MKDKWNHVMSLPAYFHIEKAILKKPADNKFFLNMCKLFKMLFAVPVVSMKVDGVFSVENGSTIGSIVVAMLRNQLRK